jgi:hypothetical protein
MSIQTDIQKLESVLSEALMNEFEAQGHKMSGTVVRDIEYVVKTEVNKISIAGMMYPYANYLAAGTKAAKVPFSGIGGGGTSLYIQALKNYAKVRMGIENEKKALSVAFAIAHTQKKHGMPTPGSYSYSSTGKRTEWISDAFKNNEDKITEVVSQMAFNMLVVKLDTLIEKWQISLNQS